MVCIIRTTEEDATPETRFIRHTPAGSVELPNFRWMRSPKQREYAICLDPESPYCCWLMLEGWDNNWVSVRKLEVEELVKLRDRPTTTQAGRVLITAQLERMGHV